MLKQKITLKPVAAGVLQALALMALVMPALSHADETTDLGAVSAQAVDAQAAANSEAARKTASGEAPAQASLDAMQPQSVIGQSFIEDSNSPYGDYTAVEAVAPGMATGIAYNGTGLSPAKASMRGIQDGNYNMTFDGIPFGDTNGPTHHSTAYFPASILGEVDVERGPGYASDPGVASEGGAVNLFSRPLTPDSSITPSYTVGSWNTQDFNTLIQSGTQKNFDGLQISADYENLTSDGYLTLNSVQRKDYTLKMQKPVGENGLLTFFMSHENQYLAQSDASNGLTLAQAAQFGNNMSLTNNSHLVDYVGYNHETLNTDMDYLRFQDKFKNGWSIDNNAYFYDYSNQTTEPKSYSLTAGSATNIQTTPIYNQSVVNGIPGFDKQNWYEVYGDIFKASKPLGSGVLNVGMWIEHSHTSRHQYYQDLMTGLPDYVFAVNGSQPSPSTGSTTTNVKFDQGSRWMQYQPFAEYVWHVNNRLTVTPGVKYEREDFTVDAYLNQGSRLPLYQTETFDKPLAYLAANYKLTPSWSTYAQMSQGMYVPDISSFQSAGAPYTSVQPELSNNYQLGVVHNSNHLTFDADVYYIDISNKIEQVPGTNQAPVYFNGGSQTYRGVETEGAYAFGNGIAVFASASASDPRITSTGLAPANAPKDTEALGVIYKSFGWSDSILYHRVGSSYALDNSLYPMRAYSSTDAHFNYTFDHPGFGMKKLELSLGLYNIFDHQSVLNVTPVNSDGTTNPGDTFFFQPPRSYTLSLKGQF